MYVDVSKVNLEGIIEYLETGNITDNGEEYGPMLFADDCEVATKIPYENGILYPQKLRTVGYADLGEGHTTLIFMYGKDDNHGTQIGSVDDNYFLECFRSGMARDEIVDELTEMIMIAFARRDGISLDDVDIDELQDSFDHPIRIVDKYLNDGEFQKAEQSRDDEER